MNKKQKIFLVVSLCTIVGVLVYWFTQGAEIFTKTQILVDKTTELDKMLGIENKEFVDKFILGLFPSGFSTAFELLSVSTISGIVLLISGILIYLFRNKKKETQ
jgi:hypothetical protein